MTFLVGDNGSGTSTIVEAVAMAYGLSRGGREPRFHEMSHGESFLAVLSTRFDSPVLAALPGATILEPGPWGLRRTTWEELELVQHWKAYLDAPGRYLRHVLED